MKEIDITGEIYFILEEAQKRCSLGLDYLSKMARRGKLKAFKMEGAWYTCERWIEEHKRHIAKHIDHEIAHQEDNLKHLRKWVRKAMR